MNIPCEYALPCFFWFCSPFLSISRISSFQVHHKTKPPSTDFNLAVELLLFKMSGICVLFLTEVMFLIGTEMDFVSNEVGNECLAFLEVVWLFFFPVD